MYTIDLKTALDWPYPVAYGKENEVEADVLILGRGSGCHAAISAPNGELWSWWWRRGYDPERSGGTGVDHWHGAFTNPCSRITPKKLWS